MDYTTDYETLCRQAKALVENVPHTGANLANLSSLIYNTLEDVNWAGFYLAEDDKLVLGPFQGKPACVEIQKGKGVCGCAFEKGETVAVGDVHSFPGHIACDPDSKSEIVVPFRLGGVLRGVLDIDSASLSRFGEADREGLEKLIRIIEEYL